MFARKLALIAVLVVATPALADFRSNLSMTGTDDGAALANGGTVEQGSVIAVTITNAQTWTHPVPDPTNRNHMTWIQINFDASTAALLPTLADATTSWAWLSGIGGGLTTEVDDWLREYIIGPPPDPPVVLSTLDYLVKRTGPGTWPVYMQDTALFDLGTPGSRLVVPLVVHRDLGSNVQLISIMALDGLAHRDLTGAMDVDPGRIDIGDTQINPLLQHGDPAIVVTCPVLEMRQSHRPEAQG